MQVLSKWASINEFPRTPRTIRFRHLVWMVTAAILAVFSIAFVVIASMTQTNIHNATLLLSSSTEGTAKITSKGSDRSRKNGRYYVAYRSTEHDSIAGKTYFPLEKWDEFEVGQTIPIWYLPNDHSVSRITQPTLQHIDNAKYGQTFGLLTLISLTGVCLLSMGVLVSREKRLAVVGIPTLGDYRLETKSAAGRTEYRCIWSFVDPHGKSKKQINKRYSPSLLPKIGDGNVTLLVDPKHSSLFIAWELFRWIDISVE